MDPESQQIKMAQQITVTTRVQRTRRSSSSKTIALLSLHCFTFTLYLASAPIGATAYRFNSNKDSSQQSSDLHENSIFHPLLPAISSSKKYASKSSTSEKLTVFYQSGNSEDSLPICSPNSVCNKIDTYGSPWVEKQCRCPKGKSPCSTSTHPRDGHTIPDRDRQYKVCEPVRTLKKCKYFRDVSWTYIMYPDNSTQQVMHCRCPKNSVPYLIKRHAYHTASGIGFQYSYACSPQTKFRCQRKEPCRLFSVRKVADRPTADDVTTSSLCQCPHRRKCPKHHLDVGVIPGKIYGDESVRTYSGYCM